MTLDEQRQAAWFDYRKDYEPQDLTTAYKAFCAGWNAAHGQLDAGGPQR